MSKIVVLPYDPTWRALEWAKVHCRSYITNYHGYDPARPAKPNKIEYFFGDEQDATLFRLRWS